MFSLCHLVNALLSFDKTQTLTSNCPLHISLMNRCCSLSWCSFTPFHCFFLFGVVLCEHIYMNWVFSSTEYVKIWYFACCIHHNMYKMEGLAHFGRPAHRLRYRVASHCLEVMRRYFRQFTLTVTCYLNYREKCLIT